MKAEYVDHMGSDLTVANAARVSFAKHKAEFDDKDATLLNYLARNAHWTPFAHPQITLRIKAPVCIRTQCFKHKQGFVENEVSRRYVDEKPEFFWPILRSRPTDGAKQGSRDEFPPNLDKCEAVLAWAYGVAEKAYELLIEQGVAPEQARMVLPQSMYTEWYWTGSLAAYARFYKQRTDPHAQKEIQDLAKMIGEVIAPLYPISWKVLTETESLCDKVFEHIKHGDEEHQMWLLTELRKILN